MPIIEESPMPRPHAGDEDDTAAILKLVLRSNERGSDAIAKAINGLAVDVKELRADVQRLAPSPRLIIATAGSVMVGVLALIIYLVSLVAIGRGIDPAPAAEATSVVVGAATTTTTTTETVTEPVIEPAAVPAPTEE